MPPHPTQLLRPHGQAAAQRLLPGDSNVERAAFLHVHARTLHAFTLITSLGDRDRAAAAAAAALRAAMPRVDELRHPERAAAWLRHRALVQLRHGRAPVADLDERRAALAHIGVTDATFDRLAGLSLEERAALMAASVERLQAPDVETVLGLTSARARRLVRRARRRFLNRAVDGPRDTTPGPVGSMVYELAAKSLGRDAVGLSR